MRRSESACTLTRFAALKHAVAGSPRKICTGSTHCHPIPCREASATAMENERNLDSTESGLRSSSRIFTAFLVFSAFLVYLSKFWYYIVYLRAFWYYRVYLRAFW